MFILLETVSEVQRLDQAKLLEWQQPKVLNYDQNTSIQNLLPDHQFSQVLILQCCKNMCLNWASIELNEPIMLSYQEKQHVCTHLDNNTTLQRGLLQGGSIFNSVVDSFGLHTCWTWASIDQSTSTTKILVVFQFNNFFSPIKHQIV